MYVKYRDNCLTSRLDPVVEIELVWCSNLEYLLLLMEHNLD